MSLPTLIEIQGLDDNSLTLKIIEVRKELFNLRLKKATYQSFKPHLFKHAKHKLAQLLTLQNRKQAEKK